MILGSKHFGAILNVLI